MSKTLFASAALSLQVLPALLALSLAPPTPRSMFLPPPSTAL